MLYESMSDGEEENPLGTSNCMQRLREERIRVRQARAMLVEHLHQLESRLQRQPIQTATFEDIPQDTKEDGKEGARSSEEDQPLPEENNILPRVILQPLNKEGDQIFTKLYKSICESQRLQCASLA